MQLGHRGRLWRPCEVARVVSECENTTLSAVEIGDKLSIELQRTASAIVTKIAALGLRKYRPRPAYEKRYPREDSLAILGTDGRPGDSGAFAEAMAKAMAAGTEKPPMHGVNNAPGTAAPRQLARNGSSLATASPLADAILYFAD